MLFQRGRQGPILFLCRKCLAEHCLFVFGRLEFRFGFEDAALIAHLVHEVVPAVHLLGRLLFRSSWLVGQGSYQTLFFYTF